MLLLQPLMHSYNGKVFAKATVCCHLMELQLPIQMLITKDDFYDEVFEWHFRTTTLWRVGGLQEGKKCTDASSINQTMFKCTFLCKSCKTSCWDMFYGGSPSLLLAFIRNITEMRIWTVNCARFIYLFPNLMFNHFTSQTFYILWRCFENFFTG